MKKNLLLITAFLAIAGTVMAADPLSNIEDESGIVETASVEKLPELSELGKTIRDEREKTKVPREELVKKYAKMVNKDGYVSDYRYNKLPIINEKIELTDVEKKLGIEAYNTAKAEYDKVERDFLLKEAALPSLKEGLKEAEKNYENEKDNTKKAAYEKVKRELTAEITTTENDIERLKTDKSTKEELLRAAKEAANEKLSTFGTDVEKYSGLDQQGKDDEKARIVGYGKELKLSNRRYKEVAREYVGVEKKDKADKANNVTFADLNKVVDGVAGRVFENAVNTEKNTEAIAELKEDVDVIFETTYDEMEANGEAIVENKTAIAENTKNIRDINTRTHANSDDIKQNTEAIEANAEAIADINKTVEATHEVLHEDIMNNEEAIAELDKKVETLDEDVDARFEAAHDDIEANTEAIEANEEAILRTHDRVDKNEDAIAENKEAIAENKDAIAENKEAIAGNEEAIAGNAEAIEDLDTYVDALSDTVMNNLDYIEANEKAIVENKTAIVENKTAIARNTQDIKDLRKDHNRGMAQMAAMASVDFGNVKARTVKVGAAVGHHSSETAVAVGVAVAPTDALMVNAKWSTSANSIKKSTLGLGATYEFNF